VLKLLAEDPAIAATKGSRARKLWAVCGLPDFRKVGSMHHARMVRRLFSYIGEGGHIPHEWFAAEVARLDNVAGDIEALADRLAAIRSWAYIAQRVDWLADPAKWAERTMAVEARLSDALHERLTQRFVDRRTAVLVRDIGARGADALPVISPTAGSASVRPIHLAGFWFRRSVGRLATAPVSPNAVYDELTAAPPDYAMRLTPIPAIEVLPEAMGLAVGWDGYYLAVAGRRCQAAVTPRALIAIGRPRASCAAGWALSRRAGRTATSARASDVPQASHSRLAAMLVDGRTLAPPRGRRTAIGAEQGRRHAMHASIPASARSASISGHCSPAVARRAARGPLWPGHAGLPRWRRRRGAPTTRRGAWLPPPGADWLHRPGRSPGCHALMSPAWRRGPVDRALAGAASTSRPSII
jgi:ATP-dependent RNA helicase SUPV3L1/SUV3